MSHDPNLSPAVYELKLHAAFENVVKQQDIWPQADPGLHATAEFLALHIQHNRRLIPQLEPQTRPTNCLQACIANLLHIDIQSVPSCFDGDEKKWDWDACQRFLLTYGLQAIEVDLDEKGTKPVLAIPHVPTPCILTGKSPRGGGLLHAVCGVTQGAAGIEIAYDPHLSGDGITEVVSVMFLIPVPTARDDEEITVCASCLRACCWHGIFYCEMAKDANTVELPLKALRAMRREHPCYWNKEEPTEESDDGD